MRVLETPRLLLRRLTMGDVDALYAVMGDPEALHLWPRILTREEMVTTIQRMLLRYERDGHGLWAMVLKESNECIGDCGVVRLQVDGRSEDEIGYHLQKKHWGRGYATEAAAACRDYGFEVLGKTRLISLILPHNTPSRRVAERIGMQVEGETQREIGGLHLVYSITAARSNRPSHPCP